ncbi:solute carrier family 49 member 4 homolog [Asterias rubens]|uniref:solute carrier family 49 member 4 homolog n=1 Tax=Asterias rubens TaxID=7604 RepID=UPI00145561F9|nr:solute carrier family 49 member 4 homolog [Asterias rubens]
MEEDSSETSVTLPLLSNNEQDKTHSCKENRHDQEHSYGSSGHHGIHSETYVAYKTRWYILAIFSLLYAFQANAWNAWGPIAGTVQVVLQWSQAEIDLCINWGPVSYVIAGLFFSYILTIKGFRFALIASALFLLSGTAIRCLPVGIENIKWTANIGQVFIGLSAPILQSAPTHLSAIWFPPHQRTTSTAIAGSAGCLGLALSFVLGSNIVPTLPKSITADNITAVQRETYFNSIMNLLYIQCAMIAVIVIGALLYLPDKPPTPPSVSATEKREGFVAGTKALIKSASFWIPALSYSVSTGIYVGWDTQLVLIFNSALGVTQTTVGWIGFYANIAATIGTLVLGIFVDFLGGHMKLVLLVAMLGLVGNCVWCVLLSMHYIQFSMASLYISCIAIGFFANAPIPLYFEVTVEGMYPIAEGTVNMWMGWLNNAFMLIFVLLPQILPGIGVAWLNWVFLVAVILCLPLLLAYKEKYKRFDLDTRDEINAASDTE